MVECWLTNLVVAGSNTVAVICTHQVSNSKWNLLFFNLELVTRKQKSESLTIELVT